MKNIAEYKKVSTNEYNKLSVLMVENYSYVENVSRFMGGNYN